MYKFIGTTVAKALIPKVITAVAEGIETLWDYISGTEPDLLPVKTPRKKPDNTKFTNEQISFIRQWHSENSGTGEEHAIALNEILQVSKSRSAYTRIWANKKEPIE